MLLLHCMSLLVARADHCDPRPYVSWLVQSGLIVLTASSRRSKVVFERQTAVKRFLKVLTYIAAGLYLLVDAIFMTVAKPSRRCTIGRSLTPP